MSKVKNNLAIKATSMTKMLRQLGHKVPLGHMQEVLAKQEGFSCYAAYKAMNDAKEAHELAKSSYTKLVHLTWVNDAEWRILPLDYAWEDLEDANQWVSVVRDLNLITALTEDPQDALLPVANSMLSTMVMESGFVAAPCISRYGFPDLDWLETFGFSYPKGSSPADECFTADLGDDSGGFTVLQLKVSDSLFADLLAKDAVLQADCAEQVAQAITEMSKKYEFKVENLNELLLAEYANDGFVVTPKFVEKVRAKLI